MQGGEKRAGSNRTADRNFSFSLSVTLDQITFKSRLNDLIFSSCGNFFQTFSFLLTRKKEYVKVNE